MGDRVEVGGSTVSRLREQLSEQIARRVQSNGLVVWEDDRGAYRDVAPSVVPEGVGFEAFDGSWYDLRRRIEDAMAGERPPSMVLYVPPAPPDDPLAELRAAGVVFKPRLATLVRQAMAGQLTDARIADIGRRARTFLEAEHAIAGNGEADVRLVALMGTADTVRMLVDVLTGGVDAAVDGASAWPSVVELCQETVGAAVAGARQEVRDGLFRHLLLCELGGQSALPDDLAPIWRRPSAAQQRRALDVLERLRNGDGSTYRSLADRADTALSLAEVLAWREGLGRVIGTPAVDAAAFSEAVRRLEQADHDAARRIAEQRRSSPWAADPDTGWGSRWRAVEGAAQLSAEIARASVPASTSGLLGWYARDGWRVDRAHRRLELARTELGAFGELEETLTAARIAYDAWLDTVLSRFTSSLTRDALDFGELVCQGDVHDRFVAGGSARTAYVWVDALRYELGVELCDALRPIATRVELHAAVAAPPTITPVGMASLLPGASSGLRLTLDGERLVVAINGNEIRDVPDRRALLRARHGTVPDLDLNAASQKGEKALAGTIGDAGLVLLRSQEVDAADKSGLLSVAWSHFETVVNLLASVIARLAQAGVERVVIAADHGFIALGQDLGSQRTVDPPAGAVGVLKRRVFIGRGGLPGPATVRVPLAACGVPSDLDLIVPRGLAVFRAAGGRQFFHGGLSPQELVVPVIVVELARSPAPQKLEVGVQVAGGRITTGVFAATLTFSGNLFTDRVTVRVVASGGGGQPVARVVSGDGFDPQTGTVTVSTARDGVLTFQATGNLSAGTTLDLQVLDARTGRKLAASSIAVAAPIVVEDDLG